MPNIKMIAGGIVATLVVVLWVYVHNLKSLIDSLEDKISQMKTTMIYKKLEKERLENTIVSQNKSIELLRASDDEARAKLAKWKQLPPKVRYKVVYRDKEVKSNDCKDIKNVIDAVRDFDISRLQ
jgi:hypothetical protein